MNDNTKQLRECLYNDKPAFFHCWINRQDVIAPAISIGGHPGGQFSATFGLVEFEDGTISEVTPTLIKFLEMPQEWTAAMQECFS